MFLSEYWPRSARNIIERRTLDKSVGRSDEERRKKTRKMNNESVEAVPDEGTSVKRGIRRTFTEIASVLSS